MIDKEKKFEALFEVLRLKDAEGKFSYFVQVTKEKGDLLEFMQFVAAARKGME